jgi:N-acetylated-alpha-linked acidic dipeptidase
VRDVEKRWIEGQRLPSASPPPLRDVSAAAAEMRAAAERFNRQREIAAREGNVQLARRLNQQLLLVERRLIDPEGIPGRPWYRHLIYAPKFTYAPEVLPAIAEAVTAGDFERAAGQADRLAKAVRRAAAALDAAGVRDP